MTNEQQHEAHPRRIGKTGDQKGHQGLTPQEQATSDEFQQNSTGAGSHTENNR